MSIGRLTFSGTHVRMGRGTIPAGEPQCNFGRNWKLTKWTQSEQFWFERFAFKSTELLPGILYLSMARVYIFARAAYAAIWKKMQKAC